MPFAHVVPFIFPFLFFKIDITLFIITQKNIKVNSFLKKLKHFS